MGRGYGGGGGRRTKDYDNSMSGVLFKNERMRKGKQDPSYQGQGETDDGREFWISAWVNENDDGTKRINMKFTYKEDRSPQQRNAARGQSRGRREEEFDDHDRQRGRRQPPPDDDDLDDDIPF